MIRMSLLMEKSLNRLRGSCRQFPPAETRDMKQGRSYLRPDRSFGICGFRFPEYQEHKYRADRDGKDHAEDQVGNDTCGEPPDGKSYFPLYRARDRRDGADDQSRNQRTKPDGIYCDTPSLNLSFSSSYSHGIFLSTRNIKEAIPYSNACKNRGSRSVNQNNKKPHQKALKGNLMRF